MIPLRRWGAAFGSTKTIEDCFEKCVDKAEATGSALLTVGHSPTEAVLLRLCGDVAKVSYMFRLNDEALSDVLLAKHDGSLRAALESVLGGTLPDAAWEQTTVGVSAGGLGIRESKSVALPAFLASRVASLPHVHEMAVHLEQAGLASSAGVMAAFDKRTEDAAANLATSLGSIAGEELIVCLEESAKSARENWSALFANEGQQPGESHARGRPGARDLVADDADDDMEHPDAKAPGGMQRVQKRILATVDQQRYAKITKDLYVEGDFRALHRLNDLGHKDADHIWLWALNQKQRASAGRRRVC